MIKRERATYFSSRIVFILLALAFLFPFYIMLVYSVKSQVEIVESGLSFPLGIHWENFTGAIEKSNFYVTLLHSLITTVPTVLICILIFPPFSYVMARIKGLLRNIVYIIIIGSLMIPIQAIMFPLFINLRTLGLNYTFGGFILVRVAFSLPFNVLVMTGFIFNIPRELEEAAMIDGCGPFPAFWRVIFPLLGPIIASTAVINTLDSWNDFTLAVIILMESSVHTLPVMIYSFFGQYSVQLNYAFATVALSALPVLIFYIFMQRFIISGITAGAVKS